MKTIILATVLCLVALGSYAQLVDHNLYPSDRPSDRDTIHSSFTVIMPWAGARKQSSHLSLSSDSIKYRACYFTGMGGQGEEYLNDTVNILPQSSGTYHYRIVINRSIFPSDTLCVDTSMQTRTYDTLLIVSKYTGISQVSPAQWYAVLLGTNTLQLYIPSATMAIIHVYDAMGKAYYTGQHQLNAGTGTIAFDMPNQAAGLYFYHIQIGEQRKVLKFVKQ